MFRRRMVFQSVLMGQLTKVCLRIRHIGALSFREDQNHHFSVLVAQCWVIQSFGNRWFQVIEFNCFGLNLKRWATYEKIVKKLHSQNSD